MCEYCNGDTKILGETNTGCCSSTIWIEGNKIKHLYSYYNSEEMIIYYCPICGRNLKGE